MVRSLFIDGAWRQAARGGTMDVVDPSSATTFEQVAAATAEDIDAALAYAAWRLEEREESLVAM